MSNYNYHQLLKFLYFEGYADSYDEAEELLESMSDEEFEELINERRTHSFPLKPSEIRSVENIGRMLRGDYSVPPGGSTRSRSARKPEPAEPNPSVKKPKKTKIDLSKIEFKENFDLIVEYLFLEGYSDTIESAEIMAENISEDWVNEIIEKFNPKDYKEYHQTNHLDPKDDVDPDYEYNDWIRSRGDIRDKHTQARGVRKKRGLKEANKADEFVTSNMYTGHEDIKSAKQRRRLGRDLGGVLHPDDWEQGEPVRQQTHRDKRGVRTRRQPR